MEFKFRAGDHRLPPPQQPPPPLPPQYASTRPPAVYCLAEEGFPDACLRRNTSLITMRKPFDANEAMHCEMEMMRLREEKLMVEIERQRFLKEEARRKLMLFEREMAIRGVAQSVGYSFREQHQWGTPFSAQSVGYSFHEQHRWGTPFSAAAVPSPKQAAVVLSPKPAAVVLSPTPAAVVQSFHEWQKVDQLKSSDRLGFGAVALPPRVQPLMADDKKERQVLQADKRELIVLEKPDPNVFREKRKAETPLTSTNGIQPFGVKKNPIDEWSCALCQVTVPNERTFNEHLHGKKHKRKEAGLMATQANKVSKAAPEPLPNKRRKLLKVKKTLGSAGAEKESKKVEEPPLEVKETLGFAGAEKESKKVEEPPLEVKETLGSAGAEKESIKVEEPLQCEKTEGSFDLNTIIPNFLKLVGNGKEDKQQNELVFEQNLMTEEGLVGNKMFKFWCKQCNVGTHAKVVMLAHLNGKKHQSSLQEVDQSEKVVGAQAGFRFSLPTFQECSSSKPGQPNIFSQEVERSVIGSKEN